MKNKRIKIAKKISYDELYHYGVKGQKWGVRRGPPYPLESDKKVAKVGNNVKIDLQKIVRIPEEKFTKYALDPERAPDKAKAFKTALGYTKENYKELISDINKHFNEDKLMERGDRGHGMRYQQIMKLKGPNGHEANVLTAWIRDGDNIRLTSVYITKKEETK